MHREVKPGYGGRGGFKTPLRGPGLSVPGLLLGGRRDSPGPLPGTEPGWFVRRELRWAQLWDLGAVPDLRSPPGPSTRVPAGRLPLLGENVPRDAPLPGSACSPQDQATCRSLQKPPRSTWGVGESLTQLGENREGVEGGNPLEPTPPGRTRQLTPTTAASLVGISVSSYFSCGLQGDSPTRASRRRRGRNAEARGGRSAVRLARQSGAPPSVPLQCSQGAPRSGARLRRRGFRVEPLFTDPGLWGLY